MTLVPPDIYKSDLERNILLKSVDVRKHDHVSDIIITDGHKVNTGFIISLMSYLEYVKIKRTNDNYYMYVADKFNENVSPLYDLSTDRYIASYTLSNGFTNFWYRRFSNTGKKLLLDVIGKRKSYFSGDIENVHFNIYENGNCSIKKCNTNNYKFDNRAKVTFSYRGHVLYLFTHYAYGYSDIGPDVYFLIGLCYLNSLVIMKHNNVLDRPKKWVLPKHFRESYSDFAWANANQTLRRP